LDHLMASGSHRAAPRVHRPGRRRRAWFNGVPGRFSREHLMINRGRGDIRRLAWLGAGVDVVSGYELLAARRAGRLGDGFFPGRGEHDGLLPLLDVMRAAAKDAGRDPDAIEVSSGGGLDLDTVKRYADLGVSRFIVPPLGFDLDTLRTQLGRFSDTVIASTQRCRGAGNIEEKDS
jgi:alkanesulfonate monooxygenase SsuD/methylene tetrahydromethanopterin reductase-like flavin-dependent oxidoreductase (luciferase family)